MSALPSTINHPGAFLKSPAAGFDGVFDWSWTQDCFGGKRIKPMDFDGVVERKGNFILFETKNLGVPIPDGQRYTLEAAHRLGCFTILLIHGKQTPEHAEIWYPGSAQKKTFSGVEDIRKVVGDWYLYADKKQHKAVDVSFLNRKISALQTTLEEATALARQLIETLERSA